MTNFLRPSSPPPPHSIETPRGCDAAILSQQASSDDKGKKRFVVVDQEDISRSSTTKKTKRRARKPRATTSHTPALVSGGCEARRGTRRMFVRARVCPPIFAAFSRTSGGGRGTMAFFKDKKGQEKRRKTQRRTFSSPPSAGSHIRTSPAVRHPSLFPLGGLSRSQKGISDDERAPLDHPLFFSLREHLRVLKFNFCPTALHFPSCHWGEIRCIGLVV